MYSFFGELLGFLSGFGSYSISAKVAGRLTGALLAIFLVGTVLSLQDPANARTGNNCSFFIFCGGAINSDESDQDLVLAREWVGEQGEKRFTGEVTPDEMVKLKPGEASSMVEGWNSFFVPKGCLGVVNTLNASSDEEDSFIGDARVVFGPEWRRVEGTLHVELQCAVRKSDSFARTAE